MISSFFKYAVALTTFFSVSTVAAGEFQVVSINDWGSGHIVQWEKTIDSDDSTSGAIDKWRMEPGYTGPGNISNTWMNGYGGSVSAGTDETGVYSIANESAGYRPEILTGQTLSFSVQVQGWGFNESDYSPELYNLSVTITEPESDSSAQFVSVNDWYNPSWGGGFNVTYRCTINEGPLNEWRIDVNYAGSGTVVNAWTQNYNGSVEHGFNVLDGGYSITNENAGCIPTLNSGETLTFVFQVNGAGYESGNFIPVCTDLNDVPSEENTSPVANAGPDQGVQAGDSVSLDGTASSDTDGDSLSFCWVLTQQPTTGSAQLSDPNSTMPNFVADKVGEYRISLTVNDGELDSASDEVTVTTENTTPVADAGADQSVSAGDSVTVSGDGSYDANGNVLNYDWALLATPENSQIELTGLSGPEITFVVDEPGQYEIRLIVSDELSSSAPDSVLINVDNINTVPVANAGQDDVKLVGDRIILDGTLSDDVDGDALTYAWSFTVIPEASQATLSSATSAQPSFQIDVAGQYIAQLIVSDGVVASAADTVVIRTNSIPVAIVNTVAADVVVGEQITLDGSESFDLDGDALSYQWSVSDAPDAALAVPDNDTSPATTFTSDAPGTYIFQLVVNDGLNSSEPVLTEVVSTSRLLLTVESPADGEYISEGPVTVSGSVFPASAIVVNEEEVSVSSSGLFSAWLDTQVADDVVTIFSPFITGDVTPIGRPQGQSPGSPGRPLVIRDERKGGTSCR